jgi:hypothetical protein
MLLVKYTGLIFEMRFEMFQIVMFLLSVPVTWYVWWGVLGFEDRVWVSDFSRSIFSTHDISQFSKQNPQASLQLFQLRPEKLPVA